MKKQVIEFNQEIRSGKKLPDFQAGDVVKMHLKVKEGGKERIQIFEGLIIAVKGKQSSSPTITVRKVSNAVGVEMIMPLYSERLTKIELLKRAKVRRAKLYYVRGLTPKQSRMKYKDISHLITAPEEEKKEEVAEKTQEDVGEEKLASKIEEKREAEKKPEETKEEKVKTEAKKNDKEVKKEEE